MKLQKDLSLNRSVSIYHIILNTKDSAEHPATDQMGNSAAHGFQQNEMLSQILLLSRVMQ